MGTHCHRYPQETSGPTPVGHAWKATCVRSLLAFDSSFNEIYSTYKSEPKERSTRVKSSFPMRWRRQTARTNYPGGVPICLQTMAIILSGIDFDARHLDLKSHGSWFLDYQTDPVGLYSSFRVGCFQACKSMFLFSKPTTDCSVRPAILSQHTWNSARPMWSSHHSYKP